MYTRKDSNNYYVNLQRANILIKNEIHELIIGRKNEINILALTMKITDELPVGEKSVKKRIEMHLEVNLRLEEVEGEIILKEDE